jgi:putative nucleotidyltransferase with HDIG domain
MEQNSLTSRTEHYVQELMSKQTGNLVIAHDFKHVDRVRNWALLIASKESFPNPELAEVTALLHDIGLTKVSHVSERKEHGTSGAEMAEVFLRDNSNLRGDDIFLITDAIKYHSLSPLIIAEHLQNLGDKGKLLEIINDADLIDALGAVGIMRAFTSKYFLSDYDPAAVKGMAWDLSDDECRKKFGVNPSRAIAPVNTIIDQINQQIRYYDNLHTMTAKSLVQPLVNYMKNFVIQLEREINHQTMPSNVI